LPENSNAYETFYEKAWDPAMYEQELIGHGDDCCETEKVKLHINDNTNTII
jgi:hypothetical protein